MTNNPYTARRIAAEKVIAKQMRFWRIKRAVRIPEMIGRLITWARNPRCVQCHVWFDPMKLQPYGITDLCLECLGATLKAKMHRVIDLQFSLIGREN